MKSISNKTKPQRLKDQEGTKTKKIMEKMQTPLADLDLSVRAYNLLQSYGVTTFADVCSIFIEEDEIQTLQQVKVNLKQFALKHLSSSCEDLRDKVNFDKLIRLVLDLKSCRLEEVSSIRSNIDAMLNSIITTTTINSISTFDAKIGEITYSEITNLIQLQLLGEESLKNKKRSTLVKNALGKNEYNFLGSICRVFSINVDLQSLTLGELVDIDDYQGWEHKIQVTISDKNAWVPEKPWRLLRKFQEAGLIR